MINTSANPEYLTCRFPLETAQSDADPLLTLKLPPDCLEQLQADFLDKSLIALYHPLERGILLVDDSRWQQINTTLSELPRDNADYQRLRRAILQSAIDTELNEQGLQLPYVLMAMAGLNATVSLSGGDCRYLVHEDTPSL